jgi:DNA-binding LytR/AlgR family response regulator
MIKIMYPNISEIVLLKGDINYTEFHLENGKKLVSSFTLLRHQEKLGSFVRISRNYLVNPAFVKKMERSGTHANIEMVNGSQLKISRRRIGEVKEAFACIWL